MYSEDDLLPISALQHLEFCPRRCALVHVEGVWADNVQTAEGRSLHGRVHEAPSETIGGVRIARGLRLASRKLGLYGIADVVEFQPTDRRDECTFILPGNSQLPGGFSCGFTSATPAISDADANALPPSNGEQRWIAYPVEYKRGRRKSEMSYCVQLCAQALCLEEMLGGMIPAGALYHGQSRRRQEIVFDDALRTRTWNRIGELHRLVQSGKLPPPVFGPKCKFCSLVGKCMPKLQPSQSAAGYVARTLLSILSDVAE
jgi:CRISPR-associated exonuclease Cas4